METDIIVIYETEEHADSAAALAEHLSVPVFPAVSAQHGIQPCVQAGDNTDRHGHGRSGPKVQPGADPLMLMLGPDGLSLSDGSLKIRGDFTRLLPRLRPSNLNGEFLVKAAKLKNGPEQPILVDATAGMGEDSLLLAAAGFRVILYEYNPVIAALLKDTIERAVKNPDLSEIAGRMTVIEGSSIDGMKKMHAGIGVQGEKPMSAPNMRMNILPNMQPDVQPNMQPAITAEISPDVIFLDPMFPERRKSALIGKKFQLLHRIEMPCADEADLLDAAIAAAPRKIIIKRPLKGPYLAGIKPDYSLTGTAVRIDCILPRSR